MPKEEELTNENENEELKLACLAEVLQGDLELFLFVLNQAEMMSENEELKPECLANGLKVVLELLLLL